MWARNLFSYPLYSTTFAIFFISNSLFVHATASTSSSKNARETIEIIIGLPPIDPFASPPSNEPNWYSPEPPPCPPPPPPPQEPPCPPPSPPPQVHPPPPPPQEPPCPPPSPPPQVHPPPKPPSTPPPSSSPLTPELASAIRVIQRFGRTITSDPFNITKTWVGNDLCRDKTKYVGYVCDNKKLVGVDFDGYSFYGNNLSVKNFIEQIKSFVIFHVNSNNFTGQIPFGISSQRLPKLFELDLSNNKLVGSFPKAVLGATNLTYLDVRFNQLTGPVDPDVFKMDLDVLFLNDNGFSGQIPETFGLTHALFITLANNKFYGQIPKSIGQASKYLLEVLFLNNQLSGCLPYEIGLLKLATVFDASVNKLTGPIPHSFGCLKDMQLLNISYNELYGEVPESLCKLSNLDKLTLKYNYFTQVGPECRKLIKENVLDISMNCILGLGNQRNPKECTDFFSQSRTCQDMKSLSYVPCDIDQFSSRQNSGRVDRRTKTHSTTYAAINRHHL